MGKAAGKIGSRGFKSPSVAAEMRQDASREGDPVQRGQSTETRSVITRTESSSQEQSFENVISGQTLSDQRYLAKAGTLGRVTAFIPRTFRERSFRSSVMISKSATRPKDGDEVNPKIDLAPNSNTEKEPDDWASGGDPMTGAQASYLKTLSEECGAPDSFETNLTKAEASKRIDSLKSTRKSVQTDKPR
jgi:hypothetical protein